MMASLLKLAFELGVQCVCIICFGDRGLFRLQTDPKHLCHLVCVVLCKVPGTCIRSKL